MMNGDGYRCNLTEIWPFPVNLGGGGGNAAAFGMGQLGDDNDSVFGDNRDHVAVDDPMAVDQRGNNNNNNNRSKKRREDDDSSRCVSTSSRSNGNSMLDGDGKRLKTLTLENENQESKPEDEKSTGKKPSEPSKQDYIHVRARRGQATDSHSLAERARREKISERMKILQDLVPGCNKVIGKALVLDEIINYIQSLQQQVEFLSMKLEAVTSRSHPSPQGFPSKDFGQQPFDMGGVPFASQPTREFSNGSSPEWLHMQIGGSFERTT